MSAMSFEKADLSAYNFLQKSVYQSKQLKNKTIQQKRDIVKSEWQKLKASSSFETEFTNVITKYKVKSKKKQLDLLSFIKDKREQPTNIINSQSNIINNRSNNENDNGIILNPKREYLIKWNENYRIIFDETWDMVVELLNKNNVAKIRQHVKCGRCKIWRFIPVLIQNIKQWDFRSLDYICEKSNGQYICDQ